MLHTKCYCHAKMNLVIAIGLKHIWESKVGTPSSARIIEDVDMVLKATKLFYRTNGAAVVGLAVRNVHRRKVVGKVKSVSWGILWTKGKERKCELTKNMSLHSDMLMFCLNKKTTSLTSSLTQQFLTI